jgi:hypothetical protein
VGTALTGLLTTECVVISLVIKSAQLLPYACIGELAKEERVALLGLAAVTCVDASGRLDARVAHDGGHSGLVSASGDNQE